MNSNILKPTKWKIILVVIIILALSVVIVWRLFGGCYDCSPGPSEEERKIYESAVQTKDYKLCQMINPKTTLGGIGGGVLLRDTCFDSVFRKYFQEGDKSICNVVDVKDVEIERRLRAFCYDNGIY